MFGYAKRKTPEELLDDSAELFRTAFLDAAKETLNDERDNVHELIASVFPALTAALAANFLMAVARVILEAIISKKHASDVQNSLNKLIKSAMGTGIDQLRIAMELEIGDENIEQTNHRVSRYRDALVSFDKALSMAGDDEKPTIHFYRAMISMRIPGATREAVLHLHRFKDAVEQRHQDLQHQLSSEESLAEIADQKANSVTVPSGYRGVGGGAIGMAEAVNANKRSELKLEARNHRSKAQQLRSRVDQLAQAADCADVMIQNATHSC